MNNSLKLLGVSVSLLVATPACADVTYVGHFKGIVTGYSNTDDPTDLVGQSIDISFTAALLDSYTNFNGDIVPNYVAITSFVGNSSFSFNGLGTNELSIYGYPSTLYEMASFTGGPGSASLSAYNYSPYGDQGNAFSLTYSGAGTSSGPVMGSGNANSYFYDFLGNGNAHLLNVDFDLVSGSVSVLGAAGTPEPATWALMLCGFGVVGAALRRRNANVRLSYS